MSGLLEEDTVDCAYKINVHWSVGQLKFHLLPRAYTVYLKLSVGELL